jgi:hypothetical protein
MSDMRRRKDRPLWLKIILKVPKLSLEGFSDRLQGLFWAVILPMLLMLFFCTSVYVVACFSFPFNMVLLASLYIVVGALILRILIERALTSEEAILHEVDFRWDVERSFKEYLDVLEARQNSEHSHHDLEEENQERG